ncbi:hypothetical protein HELRODRAFT_192229 [Helobdella robusta]|uniref:Uncharacterized protein n=1 Tax=Helobdella robusta TaxID=6412 RepID=T1FTQ8_HELRO|nr:hypothetical protein HELRODRAFT_192229 [Helobdella robusta]ESO01664.1 hypothetical protein HELRODRAFT_192229 [Helobdella robusta]
MADELDDDWWMNSANESKLKKSKKRKLEKDSDDNNNKISKAKKMSLLDKEIFNDDDEEEVDDVNLNDDDADDDGIDAADGDENKETEIKKIKKNKFEKRTKHSKKKAKSSSIDQSNVSVRDVLKIINEYHMQHLTSIERERVQLTSDDFSLINNNNNEDDQKQKHTPLSFLRELIPKWKRSMKMNSGVSGSPIVIIVCSSAIRCVEFIRQIKDLKSGDKYIIAKLFAKHLKLDKTQDFLRSKVIHLAVGTPNRLAALISSGDLRLTTLKHLVLDVNHRDSKLLNMLQIKIVKNDVITLLTNHIIPVIKNNNNNNNNNDDDNNNNKPDDDGDNSTSKVGRCRIALF